MARVLKGDIVWADLDPTQGHESGRRPVLVLSQDVFNERSGTVIACAFTSQEPRAGFPLTLELSVLKLPKRSWVKISQIRTLSMKRLGKKLGRAFGRTTRSGDRRFKRDRRPVKVGAAKPSSNEQPLTAEGASLATPGNDPTRNLCGKPPRSRS